MLEDNLLIINHMLLCNANISCPVQWVQGTSVMRLSSPARQTTAVSLCGPVVTVPTTASTTVTRRAVVSDCASLVGTSFYENQLVPHLFGFYSKIG